MTDADHRADYAAARDRLMALPVIHLIEALAALSEAERETLLSRAAARLAAWAPEASASPEPDKAVELRSLIGRPQRYKVLKSAKAVFNSGMSSFDCVIRNRSERGYLIETPNAARLPNNFDLVIEREQATHRVAIAWRKGDQVGVAVIS
ncbi:MAG: hypothetical protein AAFW46_12705 [Pseudomonadota bacterium]